MTVGLPILVVGGTGKTGRRVAERLRARHIPVRVGSRSPEPPFDWDRTGPRLLTFTEAVEEISRATGCEIRYQPVSLEEHAAMLAAHGVPAEVIELLTYLFGEVLDGLSAPLADGAQRALGREPRDFAEFAREAAAGSGMSSTPSFALTLA